MANKKFTVAQMSKGFAKKGFTVDVKTLDEYEPLDVINDTIDTTSASLNTILTGSHQGGVPKGRCTGFYGPSGCGKSFVVGRIASVAQSQGITPIIVDTENAWTRNAEGYGLDLEEAWKIEGSVIEDVRNDVIQIIKELDQYRDQGAEFMVIIDSLKGLRCAKEVRDVDDAKDASDMGTRAKAMSSMMSTIHDECCKKRNITFIWTNHIMGDPSNPLSAIQAMPGGMMIKFISDIIVQMRRQEAKNDDKNIYERDIVGDNSADVVRNLGAIAPIEAIKQRFVHPFIKTYMYISYAKGILPYSCMFDFAKEYGVIIGSQTYALQDGTKLGYKKNFINDEAVWKEKILPVLDPILQKALGFGSGMV